jgi:tape measure domain-containing protein
MASKQVSEILVKLGIQGLEGLDKLKSSFRELEKSIGPSNATIEKARRSIIEFGDASSRTEQLIKGQLEAFKGLRGQAEIGSSTYNKLTSSIAALETELRGSSAAIDQQRESITRATSASERNAQALQQQIRALTELQRQARPGSSAFAQLGKDIDNAKTKLGNLNNEAAQFNRALSAGFGATPEVLGGQIATLRRGLTGLRFDSEKYLETLERIRLLSITQAGRSGRAEVIAGFQAFQSPIFQGGYADPSRLPGLPNTTAALEQQLSELAVELVNVERGSAQYVEVSNRMAGIQRELRAELTGTAEAFRQLDIAQAGVERRADKIAGIQEYYRTQGPMAPGVGGYRDPVTGAMIAGGARTPGRIRVEEAAYPTPIGPQPFPEAGRRAQESIERAMDDVNRIYEDARIRRVELQSKYDQIQIDKMLDGLELEGQVREKGFKDELAAFDRQLEARDRRRRRGITAGQAVQAAGAVVSGGIFGGPEGFLGGLAGAAVGSMVPGLGTVGGAFAGSAIGAQVGAFRQQLGAAADYAAQLEKLRIALRNVTQSSSEYNQALGIIRQYSQELAIPQDVITKSFTQLTASVIGAGGSVKDAEVAFRGIAAGIRGTGGSVENLNAAVTATAQVFSKGKVSAEELRGQIGERLPGAFSLFAESIGKTPQQLDKALEQGQVSLLDFQKFAEKLFEEYGESAKQIASGPEAAGDRLKTSLSNLSESVGTLLRPIGAEFQTVFAQIVTAIDSGIRKLNEFLGRGRQGEINEAQRNLDATENRIKELQQRISEKPGMGLTEQFTADLVRMQARRAQQFGRLQSLLAADMSARGITGEAPERPGLPGISTDAGGDSRKEAEKLAKQQQKQYEEAFTTLSRIRDMSLKNLLVEELTTIERDRRAMIAAGASSTELEALQLKERQLQIDIKQTAINEHNEKLSDLIAQGRQKGLDVSRLAEQFSQNQLEYKQLQLEAEQNMTAELALQKRIIESMGLTKEMQQAGRAAGLSLFDFGAAGGAFAGPQVYEPQNGLSPAAKTYVDMKNNLTELLAIENQVATNANTIGQSFSTAFTQTISGATSAREALAGMMKSIAEGFLQMAQQIIAQQLTMIIYGTIMKALGINTSPFGKSGAPNLSGVFSGGQAAFNPAAFSMPALNANGNVYAQNGIQPFAMGGIVNKPTLFKYAEGGSGRFGLMGEAGPEAIMPLKRGRDGKLGISGGGGTSVVVNVDASGSQVQGDTGKASQLGSALSAAVQAELIKQKRPGGLLA